MQKIFNNANVFTLNADEPLAQAFFVNDETVVLVGENSQISEMGNNKTKIVNFDGHFVMPTFFETNYIFSKTKKEFIKSQNELIEIGVQTIWAREINDETFKLLQELSENKLLKVDVIGYVDFRINKDIMNENCRSYRKYKNGFRLGGYNIKLDGDLLNQKAWLEKPYKRAHGFVGYGEMVDEELIFVIKTAIEEKKQLLVSANGERAIEQFLRCYCEAVTDKSADNFKVLIETNGLISNKQLKLCAERKIGVLYNYSALKFSLTKLKERLGKSRVKKMANIKRMFDAGVNLVIACDGQSTIEIINELQGKTDGELSKVFKQQKLSLNELLKTTISNASYFSFEEEHKGNIENGKKANFVVFEKNPFENLNDYGKIKMYVDGKEIK